MIEGHLGYRQPNTWDNGALASSLLALLAQLFASTSDCHPDFCSQSRVFLLLLWLRALVISVSSGAFLEQILGSWGAVLTFPVTHSQQQIQIAEFMNPGLQQVCLVVEGHCSVIRVLQNWQCVQLRVNHFSVSVHWGRTAGKNQKQSGNERLVGKYRWETGHLAQAQAAWTLPAGSLLGFTIFICTGAGSME